jgi:hypothetical protein
LVLEACEELGVRPVDFVEEDREQPAIDSAPEGADQSGTTEELLVPNENGSTEKAAEADLLSSSVGPFTGYSEASAFPDPREASPANVRDVLRQIIGQDGPLTRSSVYRLYVEGCPSLQRVGKIVQQALNRALGTMLRAGEIVQEDELHDGSPDGQVLRLAGAPIVKLRPAGKRDLLEIPPSELLAVLRRSRPESRQFSGDSEALFRSLLEHYGFSRLTKPRREYLAKVLRLLRETAPRSAPGSTHEDATE